MPRPPDPKSKGQQVYLKAKPGEETKIRAFKEICARNSIRVRDVLMEKVDAFLREHNWPPGNSQTVLEVFIGDVQHKCYRCKGMFPTLTEVEFISGLKAGLCGSCLEQEQAKGPYCTIKRILAPKRRRLKRGT